MSLSILGFGLCESDADGIRSRVQQFCYQLSFEKFEAKWWGVSIDGRDVFADADAIFRMEDAGILDLKDLYSNGGPEK
ncbi:MAG: hypothetical protein WCA27_13595 [Candidatus Sulfotelmatobacter sp.]